MPKAFSDHEKELIGKRLLEQGYKMFSTYGLKKTNIEEVATAAGISKGAFYIFYESKEALFMDVVEEVEKRVRQEILTTVDLPGSSPRTRLFTVLKTAFTLFKTVPMLQFITGSDYDLLFRRAPPEKLQEHLANDRAFFDVMIARCKEAGIPIQVQTDQISSLLYMLVTAIFHQDDLGRNNFAGAEDIFLELIAAFCLGEIEIQSHPILNASFDSVREWKLL